MKKILAALALVLGLAMSSSAQVSRGITDYNLAEDWDLDSVVFISPSFTNIAGFLTEPGNQIPIRITTVGGGSTTVTASVLGTSPFHQVAVGDEITVNISGPPNTSASAIPAVRYVTAKASDDSITVGPTAVDLSGNGPSGVVGFPFRLKKFTTSTTGGWIPVGAMQLATFIMEIDQINTTSGIDYKVECRHRGNGVPDIVFAERAITTVTTTGTFKVDVTSPYDDCRIMLRMNTTDDGSDVGGAIEKINITFHGVVRN